MMPKKVILGSSLVKKAFVLVGIIAARFGKASCPGYVGPVLHEEKHTTHNLIIYSENSLPSLKTPFPTQKTPSPFLENSLLYSENSPPPLSFENSLTFFQKLPPLLRKLPPLFRKLVN